MRLIIALASNYPNSYLQRLFSPENLPNIGLFLAGIVGIGVAISTLKSISRQADLLEKQITIPFRGYLAIGEPYSLTEPERFRLKFPIRNYGHMAAKITSISIEVVVQITDQGTEIFRRYSEKKVEHTIPPERDDMFAIEIELPQDQRNNTCVVSGKIAYDAGFTQLDSFEFVRVFVGWYSKWTTASVSEIFAFTEKTEDGRSSNR
jgi:hypothetical protein